MNESTSTTAGNADQPPLADVKDAAWVRVPTRYSPAELAERIRDPEVLLRINPYYYFKAWTPTGTNSYHVAFENQSNQQQLALDIEVASGPGPGLTLHYRQGIKRRTVFTIEPFALGSYLVVTDDYERLSEAERKGREAEVDKSLAAWGEALRAYFIRQRRYGWIPGWRWYIRRVWIPMRPSARRIVWLLYLITVVEFFFFLFVILIWVLEQKS